MRERRPVFYFARMVPSYRIAALARLNDRLGGRLVVCHGHPPENSSLRSIVTRAGQDLRSVELKNVWLGGERVHVQNFSPAFRAFGRPSAIIAEESPRTLSLPLLMLYARIRKIPVGLWGHFSSNSRAPSDHHWEDRYRMALAARASACICYTDPIADLVRPYVDRDRVFVARNTLDTDALNSLYDGLALEGRRAVRSRLNLPTDAPILCYIGRLVREKGTEDLLRCMRSMQRTSRTALIVVGDGPEREVMERRVQEWGLRDVLFVGAIADLSASAPYLYASDAMLLPGYVGLAVNHAFSLGLPVITYRSPGRMRYHSPEIAYVEHGSNGLTVEHGNIDALVAAVGHIVRDRDAFSRNALAYAREELSLDRMIDGLSGAVRHMESAGGGR